MTLIKIALSLFAIFIIYAVFSGGSTATKKQWCMDIISKYENDNASISFDEEMPYAPAMTKKMDPDGSIYRTPFFLLENDGRFRCVVPTAGGLFPAEYQYTSEKRAWYLND